MGCNLQKSLSGNTLLPKVIAAFKPGAGSALMEYAEKQFGNTPLYLENSMPERNTAFYQKFGFWEISTIDIEDHEVMLMLKK